MRAVVVCAAVDERNERRIIVSVKLHLKSYCKGCRDLDPATITHHADDQVVCRYMICAHYKECEEKHKEPVDGLKSVPIDVYENLSKSWDNMHISLFKTCNHLLVSLAHVHEKDDVERMTRDICNKFDMQNKRINKQLWIIRILACLLGMCIGAALAQLL